MKMSLLTKENFFLNLASEKKPWHGDYLAMYSTQWSGIVTDPDLMMLPIDDHLVHRGDGVFDVMRCVGGKIYQMEAHLERLERSAGAVSLKPPPQYKQIREIIKALVLKGGEKDCLIRVTISRGPGGFTTDPFECPASQMYINVIRYHSSPEKVFAEGIPIITSRVPVKKSFFATIKSCNYLPNVLMKMEAINAGCEYSVSLDEDGFLAEAPTENICVLSRDGVLKFPGFEKTLAGITAKRSFELAEVMVKEKRVAAARFDRITLEEAYLASEIMLMGTSINVIPVVSFDGRSIGQGFPGPVYRRLSALLEKDMTENSEVLTDIDWRSG